MPQIVLTLVGLVHWSIEKPPLRQGLKKSEQPQYNEPVVCSRMDRTTIVSEITKVTVLTHRASTFVRSMPTSKPRYKVWRASTSTPSVIQIVLVASTEGARQTLFRCSHIVDYSLGKACNADSITLY